MGWASAYYDRHLRDPQAKRFYNSSAWKRSRANCLAAQPWCTRCGKLADTVHHVKAVQDCFATSDLAALTDQANLRSYCGPCHSAIEREAALKAVPSVSGILKPAECDEFYYDPEAAERPIRFIRKYCRHYEGKWAGEPLELQDWQAQIIMTLYGWKRVSDQRRRFTELFLLSAKGAGKTPMLSAIGEYELFAGGEPAAHVVSMATNFKQANLTMEWAKKSIAQDAVLDQLAERLQYEIRVPQTNAKWTTISGTFSGTAGFRPSIVLADEAWEWPSSKLYDGVSANLFKRSQPLLLVASNAGETRECFCWHLYEQAKAVLAGTSARTDLLPAIFEAPESEDWASEAAARMACPSIPDVVTFESLAAKITKAKEDPAAEAEYRRLHLSQWRKSGGAKSWLDIAQWDACVSDFTKDDIKGAALYVGLDLSEGDDLCSANLCFATPDKLYNRWINWIPSDTAAKYEGQGAGRYTEWSEDGHIRLLEEPTIGPKVRREIADELIALNKVYPIKAVCYDPYRADECIAQLEAAGINCVKIRQGYGVSSGCAELERRLKEKSIVLAPNGVARAAAEHVEVKQDERGNIWPVKPNAKGKYAGTRSVKIDPIAALVTALVEAKKHEWPNAQRKWNGGIWVV